MAATLAAGAATALLGLVFLLVAGLLYAGGAAAGLLYRRADFSADGPPPRRAAERWIRHGALRLTRLEHRRLAHRNQKSRGTPVQPAATARLVRRLATRIPVGLLGGAVLALTACGAGMATVMLGAWLAGSSDTATSDVLILAPLAAVLLYLVIRGLTGIAQTERAIAQRFLAPTAREALNRRIDELAASRAGVMEAVHEERRRIERDLHDGVQQRLVALGILLGRARRVTDPARADDLLRQAHEQSQQALTDLREVAWRIHPAALDDGDLRTVLDGVVDRTPIRVALDYDVDPEPPPITATAAYFVVAEALTNAAKHAGADAVAVSVTRHANGGDRLRIRVVDDGSGGADPSGGGLSGLARRVAALDGTFHVHSPIGGPTTIIAELPCG
ncbi:sensor histidine kinase [Yinghuangia sp. ASG 101]|uniref:sensor histidine kinase n=1 Tax=Yinghuangia sp. ASG 101 TaxID=2896848 RepID=UPI001E59C37A|nr:sensor histidine kinase [Yinghuangia sp. ASG 101]UGQ12081.1 sensor histidine kinase [Yinghuangia sp. ASG 101]